MDLVELIKGRRTIRHFLPEAPPRAVVLECLEAAAWAPNPTSRQPWKFIVLTGATLKKVCRVIEDNYKTAYEKKSAQPSPVLSEHIAQNLKEQKEKSFNEMVSFLKAKGVDLKTVGRGNFVFHNAPLGVIFATYPCKDQNFLKATVLAMENFLLAAAARGLGTCWMNAVSICQEYVKAALDLSPEMILVDGVAVGYPLKDAPINRIPRSRFPIERVTEWRK